MPADFNIQPRGSNAVNKQSTSAHVTVSATKAFVKVVHVATTLGSTVRASATPEPSSILVLV